MKHIQSVIVCLALVGCSGSHGVADFTTDDEQFIEDKIPSGNGATGFIDGWELSYSKFLVNFSDITIANHAGIIAAKQSNPMLFDLHKKGPVRIQRFARLSADVWDEVSYSISPVTEPTQGGNPSPGDLSMMRVQGLSVYVEGKATKGGIVKNIRWGFPLNTLYEHCENSDLGKGVTIPGGGEETVQLTIHGGHLYDDDLQDAKAQMRFDAIASADKNNDGEVTLEELSAVDLASLPVGEYGTGESADVKNLGDFVTALARTLGRFRGEGECYSRIRQ